MRYWIGLGANLGDRLTTLREATARLAAHGTVVGRSRVFASAAVGGPPQPPFLNAAVALESALEPQAMLAACHAIERALGRDRAREVRWGPRTLDLDLLLAGARGEQVTSLPGLALPHPRLHERAFALAPLADLDATLVHPAVGTTITALLQDAQRRTGPASPTGDSL